MKRLAACVAAVALLAPSGVALGQGPTSPQASCIGVLASFEATQLPPGSLGEETSGIAQLGPGVLGGLVRELARHHGGSVEACGAADS